MPRGTGRSRARGALALAGLLVLCAPLSAAGRKANGTTEVADDLTTGSAGSVGLAGGAYTLDGSLGQVAAAQAENLTAPMPAVEAGYFSRGVTAPASAFFQTPADPYSTIRVDWNVNEHAPGTRYRVELSTASDFAGVVHSTEVYVQEGSVVVGGLRSGTFYWGRVKALYMEGDESGYRRINGNGTPTQLYCGPVSSRVGRWDWTSPAAWDVPGSADFPPTPCSDVSIVANSTVTMNDPGGTARSLVIALNGMVSFSTTTSGRLSMMDGSITVNDGGALEMGSEAWPVPDTVRAEIVLATGSLATRYGLIVDNDARFTAFGSTKTPFVRTDQNIGPGQVSVLLAEAPAGWKAGDRVVVGPGELNGAGALEEVTIDSISGNLLNVVPAFSKTFKTTTTVYVANLSRNVVVRSSGTDSSIDAAFFRSLVDLPGNLDIRHAEFAELGTGTLADAEGVVLAGAGIQGRISSSTFHDGYFGLRVSGAAGVLVEGSAFFGNDAVGLQLFNGDAASLNGNHAAGNGSAGLELAGGGGSSVGVSSNAAYGNGAEGINIQGLNGGAVSYNEAAANGFSGVRLGGFSGNVLRGNLSRRNAQHGFLIDQGANDNMLFANVAASNTFAGIYVATVSGTHFQDSEAFRNGGAGLVLQSATSNFLQVTDLDDNGGAGVLLIGARWNYFTELYSFGNGGPGLRLQDGSSENAFSIGSIAGNGAGIELDIAQNNRLTGLAVYGNGGFGLLSRRSAENVFDAGTLGYDEAGLSSPNTNAEVSMGPAEGGGFLELMGSRVEDTPEIATASINESSKAVISWNQDFATGTLRVWGHAVLENEGVAFDYATALQASTATFPVRLRGAGHTLQVCSTNDLSAVSQVVYVVREGGDWNVYGSSSGFLGQNPLNACPGTDYGQFRLALSGGAPNDGDRLAFVLRAGTRDQNKQKKVLLGPADVSFNGGRSRIEIKETVSWTLRGGGLPGQQTVMDRLAPGGPYYSFVASGTFTAERAEIRNLDPNGLYLTGPSARLVLSSSTFDELSDAGAVNAYVTAANMALTPAATFYGMAFGDSRSVAGSSVNVRVVGGPGPDWTFRRWSGRMGGEDRDDDGPDPYSITWSPFTPRAAAPALLAIFESSATLQWADGFNDPGVRYLLEAAENVGFAPVAASSNTASSTATVTGLAANTTHHFRVLAVEVGTSPPLGLGQYATLAKPPGVLPATFLEVSQTTATAAWAARPASPQGESAEGYLLEASSSPAFSSPIVSSRTANVALSTLTVGLATALERNTTYYFRVGSLNWAGAMNYVSLGATATLAAAPALLPEPFLGVFATSASVQWAALPQAPQRDSAEGYRLEASTAANFTGVVLASATPAVTQSTLTVAGLTPYVTYYFRVGALNWNGVPSYSVTVATVPRQFMPQHIPVDAAHSAYGVAWGDDDNDGDLDLAFAIEEGPANMSYGVRNEGGGNFSTFTLVGGDLTRAVAWGDFDGDGDLDLAMGRFGTDVLILRKVGSGFSTAAQLYPGLAQDNARSVAWGDYDNDGDLDLAVGVDDSSVDYLVRNDGGGSFSTVTLSGASLATQSLAWGDYDQDGDLDLAVAKDNGTAMEQAVYRNDGGGAFTAVGLGAGTTGRGRGVAWGDFDGDGDLDLIFAAESGNALYFRNAGGGFQGSTIPGAGPGGQAVAVADYDNDGDLDAVLARNGGRESLLLRNNGAASFEVIRLLGTAGEGQGVAWGDFDGDGDLDLALAMAGTRKDLLLINAAGTENQRPAKVPLSGADLSLDYDASGSTLTVRWSASNYDIDGGSTSVMYAVAVATVSMAFPGGDELRLTTGNNGFVVPPQFGSPLLGNYLRPAYDAGTNKHRVSFRLDLPHSRFKSDQTYYISVQAVDLGLRRSSWTVPISTFVLASLPPQARQVDRVFLSSLTVTYAGVSGASAYLLEASTASNFSGTVFRSSTTSPSATSLPAEGLAANTTYYLRMGALYRQTTVYANAVPASTSTLALEPATPAGAAFLSVGTGSAVGSWSANGNPGGTRYEAYLSTGLPFSGTDLFTRFVATVSYAAEPSAAFGGLEANTTYYLTVSAVNHNGLRTGQVPVGSTVTRIETPQTVALEFRSSTTLVVSAYAPTPAFHNLHLGVSGTRINRNSGAEVSAWKGSSWTYRASMPAGGRNRLAAAAGADRIFVVGGSDGGAVKRNQSFLPGALPANDVWQTLADMSLERERLGAAAVGGKVYAVGGFNGVFQRKNERYDPGGDAWSNRLDLANGRRSHVLVSTGGKVYAIGGENSGGSLASVEVYDPGLDAWSAGAAMPAGRHAVGGAALGGKVYVLGGHNGSSHLADNRAYDMGTDSWSGALSPMPTARSEAAAVSVASKVYVVGGNGAGGRLALVEEYDPLADAWAERAPMNQARSFAAAAVLEGRVFVFGGTTNGSDGLSSVEEFDPGVVHRFENLQPNSFHSFKAQARSSDGTQTPESAGTLSVFTLAAVPSTATPTFLGVFASSVAVAWTSNNNVVGTEYRAQASTATDFTGDVFSSDWAVGFSTSLAGLAANRAYHFRVQARNGDLIETDFRGLGSTVTSVNPPVNPQAASVTASSIAFQWGANGNGPGTLYGAEISTDNFLTVKVASLTLNTGVVFGAGGEPPALDANTTYYLQVRAFNSGGAPTDYSGRVTTVTLVNVPAPHASSSYTSVSAFGLTAQWDANGNAPDTDYVAELSTDGYVTTNFSSRTKNAAATFGCCGGVGPLLLVNATYTVRVAALNRAGAASAALDLGVKATMAGFPNPASPPFSAVADRAITAAWTSVNPPGTLFEARVSTDNFLTVNIASQTLNHQATFGQGGEGVDLDPNTTYYVRVRAINKQSVPTSESLTSTITLPAPPLADGFVVGTSSIQVSWLPNGNPAGTQYEARISSDGFGSFSQSSFTSNTSARFGSGGGEAPDLTPNTTYSFLVRGIGRAGAPGAFSVQVDTPTLAEAPATPGLDAVELSSIAFSWSGGANPGGTLYEARISTDGFGTVNASSRTRSAAAVFGSGGEGAPLESNATYYLQVRAVNHAGVPTEFVSAQTTATPAAVPAGLLTPTVTLDAVLLQWDAQGNRAGTRYRAEISQDGFSSVLLSSNTANLGVLFGTGGAGGPLSPNTTYHFRVYSVDLHGRDVGPSAEVSTVTLVAQPTVLTPPFLATDVSSIAFHWGSGGNPGDTLYHAEISSDNFVMFAQSSFTRNTSALFGTGGELPALERNTTYYLRVAALNRIGVPTAPTATQSTMTLVEIPALGADPFPRVDFNAVRFEWADNGNPPGTLYRVDMATSSDFTTVDRSSVTLSTSALFGKNGVTPNLLGGNTYYFRVQAFNARGVPTPFTVVRDTVTPPGDLIPPTIQDNQPGDAVWRRSNNGVYDVDFFDAGGADLDRFQVRVSTAAGGAGPNLVDSSNVVTNINVDSYTADWSLPSGVFSLLMDGVTNYVTVIARDTNANSSTTVDAFYVLKDTTPPAFANGEAGGDLVARSAAGTLYDVDAFDPASGIAVFQYSASTQAGTGNQAVIPWTTIAAPGGAFQHTADWTVDWNALVPNATNYISIRAWDVAGTTRQVTDAFFVLKDTEPPAVGLTVPGSSFRSQLVTISGTAADSLNVQGAEVNIREAGGNYWDGATFTSASPVWFPAAGTAVWSLSPAIPWADGQSYQVVARASDTAGQYSAVYSTRSFLFDASTPTAAILAPPNGTISALPQISGTADDPDPDGAGPLGFAGLNAVEVRLRRNSDGQWWNWATETWGAVPVSSVAAVAGVNWQVPPTELLKANLAHQASYFVTLSASDNAVPPNQDPFELIGTTFTFSDTTPPAALTNLSALQGPSPGQIALSWTAPGDDAGGGVILLGRFHIQHTTDPATVVFSTDNAQVQIPTGTVRPGETHGYLLSSLTAGVTYYLRAWTRDDAGNWSAISNGATVQATPQPSDRIEGHVMKVSSEGITAVLVEAYGVNDTLVSSAFTLADGSGTFSLAGLANGVYRVQATWTADEVSSSVWLDGIPVGATGVDFILELNYTLSTLQGTLQTLAGGGGGTSSAFLAQASANQFQGSVIELYQKDRLVATAKVGPDGRWTISNLLPGKYAVRAFNGYEYTQLQRIALGEGEVREVGFVFDPLPEEAVFAFPNPARDSVTFRFVSALSPLEAQILVFDIAGTLVREIPGSELVSPSPGLYHARWDLTNGRGEDVASGVYLFLVKVKGGNGQNAKAIKKLAVVR